MNSCDYNYSNDSNNSSNNLNNNITHPVTTDHPTIPALNTHETEKAAPDSKNCNNDSSIIDNSNVLLPTSLPTSCAALPTITGHSPHMQLFLSLPLPRDAPLYRCSKPKDRMMITSSRPAWLITKYQLSSPTVLSSLVQPHQDLQRVPALVTQSARLDMVQAVSSGVGDGAVGGVIDDVDIDSTLPAMPTAAQLADHDRVIQLQEASKRAVGSLEVCDCEFGCDLPAMPTKAQLARLAQLEDAIISRKAEMWPTVGLEMVEGVFVDEAPLEVMDGIVEVPAAMMADFNDWFDEIVGAGGIGAMDWDSVNAIFQEVLGGDIAVPDAQPVIAIEDLELGELDLPGLNVFLDDLLANMP
ncbi:hypothetical protein BJ741DRAFT_626442 [Chytriomyces cf. hyalinus JEL632]|nr:hypothetical protein BJ741DRAFT_626442 [Chytriomyces cf. hyalinus JEL632]